MIGRVRETLSMFVRIDARDVERLRYWEGSYLSLQPGECAETLSANAII